MDVTSATAPAFAAYRGVLAMVPDGSYRCIVVFFHVGPLSALSLLSDSGTDGEHQVRLMWNSEREAALFVAAVHFRNSFIKRLLLSL